MECSFQRLLSGLDMSNIIWPYFPQILLITEPSLWVLITFYKCLCLILICYDGNTVGGAIPLTGLCEKETMSVI